MSETTDPQGPPSAPEMDPLQVIAAATLAVVGIATGVATMLLHPEATGTLGTWLAFLAMDVGSGTDLVGYTRSEAMRLDLVFLASLSLVATGAVLALRQFGRRLGPNFAPILDPLRIATALVPVGVLVLVPLTKIAIDQEMRRQGPILAERYDRAISMVSEADLEDDRQRRAVDLIATLFVSSSMYASSIPVTLDDNLSPVASETLRRVRTLRETVR